jgi:hypothetical protein
MNRLDVLLLEPRLATRARPISFTLLSSTMSSQSCKPCMVESWNVFNPMGQVARQPMTRHIRSQIMTLTEILFFLGIVACLDCIVSPGSFCLLFFHEVATAYVLVLPVISLPKLWLKHHAFSIMVAVAWGAIAWNTRSLNEASEIFILDYIFLVAPTCFFIYFEIYPQFLLYWDSDRIHYLCIVGLFFLSVAGTKVAGYSVMIMACMCTMMDWKWAKTINAAVFRAIRFHEVALSGGRTRPFPNRFRFSLESKVYDTMTVELIEASSVVLTYELCTAGFLLVYLIWIGKCDLDPVV